MPLSTRSIRPEVSAPARRRRLLAVTTAACVGALVAGVGPALAAFPGANGRIAFSSDRAGSNDIWTMGPSGGELVNLTPDSPADDAAARWRADGRKLVFSSNRETPTNPIVELFGEPDFELFTMHADGSNARQITFNELDDDLPAWSPDGRRVVFQRDVNLLAGPDNRNWDIFTMKVSGGRERNLTNDPAQDGAASWSPDGRRIAFESSRDIGDTEDNIEVYTMRTNGSRVRRLTYSDRYDGQPNWSPDGRRISFQGFRDDHLEIWTMRANGSDQEQLTHDADAFASAWSPDGCLIAYSSFDNPGIFTIGVDGSDPRRLTSGSEGFDFFPDWQPLPGDRHSRSGDLGRGGCV